MQKLFILPVYLGNIIIACWVSEYVPITEDTTVIMHNLIKATDYWASLVTQMLRSSPAMQETQVRSLGQEDPLEKGIATHSVFLPGESHGQRNLVDYSP